MPVSIQRVVIGYGKNIHAFINRAQNELMWCQRAVRKRGVRVQIKNSRVSLFGDVALLSHARVLIT